MLRIKIPSGEYWDERNQEFIQLEGQLLLEHSLVSLAKWEARWHKPFFSKEQKSRDETIDYIRCMTLTENVNPVIYSCLPDNAITAVMKYINEPMTATTFSENESKKGRFSREVITAEIIYYWMVSFQIPFEPCENWHLNRLMTLIRVCNIKNQPKKKASQHEIMSRNAKLNAERRKRLGTTG